MNNITKGIGDLIRILRKIKRNLKLLSRELKLFEELDPFNNNFGFHFIPLVLILIILISFFRNKEIKQNNYLLCPVRGIIGVKKYDEKGYFTEEYHRIKLLNSLIRLGFLKSNIDLNYRIKIGHKGRNFFIPDAVIWKNNNKSKAFLVVEVKKDSKYMDDAINYQLKPAMKMLDSEYGIYYDGTRKNTFFRKDGKIMKDFNFLEMPKWFFYEWKK